MLDLTPQKSYHHVMDSIFEKTETNTKQGDVGEARAIYEYTRLGFTVARTLFDSAKYDLIIDDGNVLKRVQVRTTSYKEKMRRSRQYRYVVNLKTTGGNRKVNTIRPRQDNDYDVLFVLTDDNRCWSIPVEGLDARNSIYVDGPKYAKFQL